jgi:hypothetical protein
MDHDGYTTPPGCNGYGCPTTHPSSTGSPSPTPTHSATASATASVTLSPQGTLPVTGPPGDVLVIMITLGICLVVFGFLGAIVTHRRRTR